MAALLRSQLLLLIIVLLLLPVCAALLCARLCIDSGTIQHDAPPFLRVCDTTPRYDVQFEVGRLHRAYGAARLQQQHALIMARAGAPPAVLAASAPALVLRVIVITMKQKYTHPLLICSIVPCCALTSLLHVLHSMLAGGTDGDDKGKDKGTVKGECKVTTGDYDNNF